MCFRAFVHTRRCCPAVVRAARPARRVGRVHQLAVGQLEDDDGDGLRHVRDRGGHEHVVAALPEAVDGVLALLLQLAAVEDGRIEPHLFEVPGHAVA